jgi:LysM repeat protein
MLAKIFTAILLCVAATGFAQNKDSLFVTFGDGAWLVPHKVLPGENVVSIAHTFHVPATTLADVNGIPATDTKLKKNVLNIPVSDYNLLKSHPAKTVSARMLFYKCKRGENVFRIATRSGVSQDNLTQFNNLQNNNFYEGQVLLLGWVLYDTNPLGGGGVGDNSRMLPPDTLSPEQHVYLTQTGNEANITEEKGTAVFYEAIGRATGPYYAFHNGTSRGTIIKVYNPGNGKTIYVKVMGPLPDTKQYYNATIGISGTAKAALGVTDSRAWCELKFASSN